MTEAKSHEHVDSEGHIIFSVKIAGHSPMLANSRIRMSMCMVHSASLSYYCKPHVIVGAGVMRLQV
jgi:hypothetical protein